MEYRDASSYFLHLGGIRAVRGSLWSTVWLGKEEEVLLGVFLEAKDYFSPIDGLEHLLDNFTEVEAAKEVVPDFLLAGLSG